MDKPSHITKVPAYMFNGPHMVHLNGLFVHPGRDNDYTLYHSIFEESDFVNIYWWHPEVGRMAKTAEEMTISVLRLDTGERWGHSNTEGVFIDTRKQHAKPSK